jgi:hypothetical protein
VKDVTPAEPVLDTIDRAGCIELLGTVPVGRIAFTHQALPAIAPVNYLLDRDRILVRIRPGSALATVARPSVVAFQVDGLDQRSESGWTVTVVGSSQEVRSRDERERIALLPLRPWASGGRDHIVRIDLDRVTGRRLRLPTAARETVPHPDEL